MTAVPVNASGSRSDISTAKHIGRTQEHMAYPGEVRAVVDSPPHVSKFCQAIKADGSLCLAQTRGTQQRERQRCLGHIRGSSDGS